MQVLSSPRCIVAGHRPAKTAADRDRFRGDFALMELLPPLLSRHSVVSGSNPSLNHARTGLITTLIHFQFLVCDLKEMSRWDGAVLQSLTNVGWDFTAPKDLQTTRLTTLASRCAALSNFRLLGSGGLVYVCRRLFRQATVLFLPGSRVSVDFTDIKEQTHLWVQKNLLHSFPNRTHPRLDITTAKSHSS